MKESGFDSGFIRSLSDIKHSKNVPNYGNEMIGYILRNGGSYEQEIGINPILTKFGVQLAAIEDPSDSFKITTCPSQLHYDDAYLYFHSVVEKLDFCFLDRCLIRLPRRCVSAWSSKGFVIRAETSKDKKMLKILFDAFNALDVSIILMKQGLALIIASKIATKQKNIITEQQLKTPRWKHDD